MNEKNNMSEQRVLLTDVSELRKRYFHWVETELPLSANAPSAKQEQSPESGRTSDI